MQFDDELAAGVTLVRPALQSPDYVTGVSGWAIKIDGSAEFNNIVIRGLGTDPAIIIGPDNAPQVVIYNNGVNGVVEFPTNDPNESSPARLASVVYNQGAATERIAFEVQGPAHDVDDNRLAMQFNSARADSSTPASVSIFDVATQNLILFADNNRVQVNEALQVTPEDGDTNIPFFVDGLPPGATSIATIRRDGTNVLNITNDGNLQVSPTVANALSAVFVNAAAGHTGNLLRTQVNAVDQLVADATGTLTTYAANAFGTYVPDINNDGTATYSNRTGWYVRIGKMIFFSAYLVASAVGSGVGNLGITTPTAIDRTTRWAVLTNCESMTAGNNGSCSSVAFTTGSGAAFDRLRNSTGTNMIGTDITATSIITASGWYREA